jgi:methionyl-tRNA formyltransferase
MGEAHENIVIAATKPWTRVWADRFCRDGKIARDVTLLLEETAVTCERLTALHPRFVFFPHWSAYIPREIYERFVCVVFHPTDLPFGRGGTPIQNLIERGHTETVLSALRVNGVLDGGDVYMKRPLSLLGGGEEILLRMAEIIFTEMIPQIAEGRMIPVPQNGKSAAFKRRTPEMSELTADMTLRQWFDVIRMLDIDGYPKAFLRFGAYTLQFSRPALTAGGIRADVKIIEGGSD